MCLFIQKSKFGVKEYDCTQFPDKRLIISIYSTSILIYIYSLENKNYGKIPKNSDTQKLL